LISLHASIDFVASPLRRGDWHFGGAAFIIGAASRAHLCVERKLRLVHQLWSEDMPS
jgi:hypothetical protein